MPRTMSFGLGLDKRLGSRNGTIPFKSDLLEDLSVRSGSSLIDSVSGEAKATILLSEFYGDNVKTIYGDKTRVQEHIYDGNNHTIYFRFKQVADIPGDVAREIFNTGTTGRLFKFFWNFTSLSTRCSDGTTTKNNNLTTTANLYKAYEYVHVLIRFDYTAKTCVITTYQPNGTQIHTQTADLSLFVFNTNNNAGNFTFTCTYSIVSNFKKFNALKTLANCIDEAYVTDLQMHYPHILSGVDISENVLHLNRAADLVESHKFYSTINNYFLNYGVNEYQYGSIDSTDLKKYIGYKTDGSLIPIDFTLGGGQLTAYRLTNELPSSSTKVNTVTDAKLRFTNAFFDRSNATIWEDAARLGYYDASNVKDFHVTELNQRTLLSWLKPDYKGRLAVKFTDNSVERWDRKYLTEVILYTTDHKGTEHQKILTYTKDIFAAIKTSGVIDFDVNNYVQLGYLKTTKPMVVMRIDDGYQDAYTKWWPFLKTKGVGSFLCGIHTAQVGTYVETLTTTLATWAQLQEMHSEGVVIACHNNYEVDYNQPEEIATIESELQIAIAAQVSHGLPCNNYVANRHSAENPSMAYLTHKIGFETMNAWGSPLNGGGSVYTTNPQIIDLYRVNAIAFDLGGDYDLDKVDITVELQNVKDQVDLCLDNRLLVMFWHGWGSDLQNGISQVIDYINTQNIDIVSIDEAKQFMEYK